MYDILLLCRKERLSSTKMNNTVFRIIFFSMSTPLRIGEYFSFGWAETMQSSRDNWVYTVRSLHTSRSRPWQSVFLPSFFRRLILESIKRFDKKITLNETLLPPPSAFVALQLYNYDIDEKTCFLLFFPLFFLPTTKLLVSLLSIFIIFSTRSRTQCICNSLFFFLFLSFHR